MTEESAVRYSRDADGIVTLLLDDPTSSANTMSEKYTRDLETALGQIDADKEGLTGVVVTSGKKTFFAGGDLTALVKVTKADAAAFGAGVMHTKAQLRRLETLGVPVVAAINGAALGGGFEIALACHRRIVSDAPGIKLGFPEVQLGLLPGAGGVVRTVRMLGIMPAFMGVLGTGQPISVAKALELGLVDEVVPAAELVARAKAWIATKPEAVQKWDVKGYKIPGGTPASPALAGMLPAFPANLRKQLKGANYPAPHHVLCVAVESTQVDFDTAMQIENRYFVDLAVGQIAKNMTKAFFFDLQAVNGGASRPAGYDKTSFTKVAVLGAGMMGAGIAYVLAKAGVQVLLKDVSDEAAAKGKAYSENLCSKAVAKGRTTQAKADALLALITPTSSYADLEGADLVIEAVFENTDLKKSVFAETEPVVLPTALLASNTSTLPITGLAEGVSRPADFIGLHFFSPVDKMPLVEIIRGAQTSDAALAKAFDVVRLIGKTPIVVNDSRGFFTSRVIGTFLLEGITMLAEGVPAQSVEQASAQAGYPAPVLQLFDELTLTLSQKIGKEAKAALGDAYVEHPGTKVLDAMVAAGRPGRSGGAGFYDYADGKRTQLWKGIADTIGATVINGKDVPFQDCIERMLFAEAIETVKCFDEGVLMTTADANIGSIMGIGFPAWTGGVAQYVEQYEGGVAGFCTRASELAEKYGARFTPPASLLARAGLVNA